MEKYGVEYTGKGPKDRVKNLSIEVAANDEADPFADLGYGFTAYWNLLSSLSCIFFILTLIFVPQMAISALNKGLISLSDE